jgi:CTD nuclear envelope phosphatase 1
MAKKGPSLFAQRMASQEHPKIEEVTTEEVEDVSSAPVKGTIVERPMGGAGLPKFSETKPMASMKNAVVEREPAALPKPPTPRSTAGPSSLRKTVGPGPGESSEQAGGGSDENEDYDNDDDYDYDDDEDDDDDDDGDDYDLDEAFLAREIALDMHRKQGYLSLAARGEDGEEEVDGPMEPEEDMPEMTLQDDGSGGVLMALPQISDGGQIVNPTPDDLRKFVRVGRLENGNLLLAPGEEGWSDDEDEEKRAKRDEARRRLKEYNPPAGVTAQRQEAPQAEPKVGKPARGRIVLPPALATGPLHDVAEKVGEKTPDPPAEPPKKISRFKAARHGL